MGTTIIVFFFFQAEDGIRDYKVTGVQTCALPISNHPVQHMAALGQRPLLTVDGEHEHLAQRRGDGGKPPFGRGGQGSEEGRGGEEGRYRGAPGHLKKKKKKNK